ncbi:MAG: hypothetical protein COW00_13290 [Bdellovibrio sp. CG12_big_fil_rev_8_21_14_0_65_39_13]|nr:MAG: hypothetical protein COW78_11340 [Bdellovibrio sp. CG22_combo_CG10-13_8_21_14_all_39_27]PIQ58904.1 MAG: hypothetical protein COW00_13290 [Bdellovibrio sp. CG12_big_fil_rev_8_21_14_0_65_39_13]PIR35995.1 MAG: hypothetical protein COV37_05665 [Bdellovibrio sp. CG11_big_fil_rev_8_21_14_0_20_39_38]PJB53432.1 MAG: hypothetical protein CO099_07130 [Bdellovibrio sp. CG_4_9_14_3_um_filter_39_7]
MLNLRPKEAKRFKLVSYKNGEIQYSFELTKKKMLLGRFEGADICVADDHISHYHAFITVDENGGKIIDLDSDNGISINGERVKQTYFSHGDCLRFGPIEFSIEESFVELEKGEVEIEDTDAKVVVLQKSKIDDLPSELPPVPGLVVIDGEYCDIMFAEESFEPTLEVPAFTADLAQQQFVDFDDEKKDIIPITKANNINAVQVTALSMGSVISIDFLPIKNKTYLISPFSHKENVVNLPSLESDEDLPFVKVMGTDVEVFSIPGMECINATSRQVDPFNGKASISISHEDRLVFNYKTVQVVVEQVEGPPHLRPAPFFGRDREFQKQSAKFFSGLMAIFLLLLLIDTSVQEPEKKIAVIYRRAIQAKQPSEVKSSSVADSQDKDTGVKAEDQKKPDVKMAKKSPDQKKVDKKMAEQPAPAPAPAQTKPVESAPTIKGYKLDLKKTLASLSSSSKSLAPTQVKNSRSIASTNGIGAVKAQSDSALKANVSSNVGTMGSDATGNFDSSSGTKGLASKQGIDTTYTDPKTVVLGSMDPELLRKILREYLPQFRHCYQQELTRNEELKGVVDLNFRIESNGGVTKVAIKSKSAQFSATGSGCMANVLRLIEFPKPKGGGVVDVKQPLNFFSERNKI